MATDRVFQTEKIVDTAESAGDINCNHPCDEMLFEVSAKVGEVLSGAATLVTTANRFAGLSQLGFPGLTLVDNSSIVAAAPDAAQDPDDAQEDDARDRNERSKVSDVVVECATQECEIDSAAVVHVKSVQRLVDSRLESIVHLRFREQLAATLGDLSNAAAQKHLGAESVEKHLQQLAEKQRRELTVSYEELKKKLDAEREKIATLKESSLEEVWNQLPETRALYADFVRFLERDRVPNALNRFMSVSTELPAGNPFRLPILADGQTIAAPGDYHASLVRALNAAGLYEGRPYLDLPVDKPPTAEDLNKIFQIQSFLNDLNEKTILANRQHDMKVNFPAQIEQHGLPDWLRGADSSDRNAHAAMVRMLDIAVSVRKCAFAIQQLGLDTRSSYGLDPIGLPFGSRTAIPYPPGVKVTNGRLEFRWPANISLTDPETAGSVRAMLEWLEKYGEKVQQALDAQSGRDLLKQVRYGDVPGHFAVRLDENGSLVEVQPLAEGAPIPEGFKSANLLRFDYKVEQRGNRYHVVSVVQACNSMIYQDAWPSNVGTCARTEVGPKDQLGKPAGFGASDILPIRNCAGRTLQLTAGELSTNRSGQAWRYGFDKAATAVMDLGFLISGISTAGGALAARGTLTAGLRWRCYLTGAAEIFGGGGSFLFNHAEGHVNPQLAQIEQARGFVIYGLILKSLAGGLRSGSLSPERRELLRLVDDTVKSTIAEELAASQSWFAKSVQVCSAVSESRAHGYLQLGVTAYVGAHLVLEKFRQSFERPVGERFEGPPVKKPSDKDEPETKTKQQSQALELERLVSLEAVEENHREHFRQLLTEVKGVCSGGNERKSLASDLGVLTLTAATEAEKRIASVLLLALSTARGEALKAETIVAEWSIGKASQTIRVRDLQLALEGMSAQRQNPDLALFALAVQAETGMKTVFQEAAALEEIGASNTLPVEHRIAALTRLAMIANAIQLHRTSLELKATTGTSEDRLRLSEHLAQGYGHGAKEIAATMGRIAGDTKADKNVRLLAAASFCELQEVELNLAKKAEAGDIAGKFNQRINELAEGAFSATKRGVTADRLLDELERIARFKEPAADPARILAAQDALLAYNSGNRAANAQGLALRVDLVSDCLSRIRDIEARLAQTPVEQVRRQEITELANLQSVAIEALGALEGREISGAESNKLIDLLNQTINDGNEPVLAKLVEQLPKIKLHPAEVRELTNDLIACLKHPSNAGRPAFRARVIAALAGMNRLEAEPLLKSCCTVDSESSPLVRLAALQGLEKLGLKPDQGCCKRIFESERDPAVREAFLRLVKMEDSARGPMQVNAARDQSLEKGQTHIAELISVGALEKTIPAQTIRQHNWFRFSGRSPYDRTPLPPAYEDLPNEAYRHAIEQFRVNVVQKCRLNTAEGQKARLALLEIIASNAESFTGEGKHTLVEMAVSEVHTLLDPAMKLGDSAIGGMDSALTKVLSNGRVDPQIRLRLLGQLVRHALDNPQHGFYLQSVRECLTQVMQAELQQAREGVTTPARQKFREALFEFVSQLEPSCDAILRNFENSEIESQWVSLARDTRANLNHSVLSKFKVRAEYLPSQSRNLLPGGRVLPGQAETAEMGALRLQRMLAAGESASALDCVQDICRAVGRSITEGDARSSLIVQAMEHKQEMVRIAAAFVVLKQSEKNAFSADEQQKAFEILARGWARGSEYGYRRDCELLLKELCARPEFAAMASTALASQLLPGDAQRKLDAGVEQRVVDLLKKCCPEGTLLLPSRTGDDTVRLTKVRAGKDQLSIVVERIDSDNRIELAAAFGSSLSYRQIVLEALKGSNALPSLNAVQSALSLLDGDTKNVRSLGDADRKALLDELQKLLKDSCSPAAIKFARESKAAWPPAGAKLICEYFEGVRDKNYQAAAVNFREVVRANTPIRLTEAPQLTVWEDLAGTTRMIAAAEQEGTYAQWHAVALSGLCSSFAETRRLAIDAILRQPKPSRVDAVVAGLYSNRSGYSADAQAAICELYEKRRSKAR